MRDAGDIMAMLREFEVDMVLCGHRHVPYLWSISGVRVVHSGTASSERTRGIMLPSYNVIEIGPEEVSVTLRRPGEEDGERPLASFSRHPATTAKLYPGFDEYVRYYELPF